MKFKTVQFISVWCCVCVQCIAFQSYSNHFLFCSLLWLMYLSCILYQIVARFDPIQWYGMQGIQIKTCRQTEILEVFKIYIFTSMLIN
ncbi:hypothetical protein T03_11581 [Trichinella britovi]|uniref:Uncharacterized protein n=1 Tax=Trichinella britovi TaxID=45882 RepID=A0A0V1CMQ4_TRIBR|nr:hypothetical protein T03_11581 [Trichinella britovi]